MRCCYRVLRCLLLGLLLATAVRAQPEPQPLAYPDDASVRFDHLTNNDGLSQMFVSAIVQDRRGFMWFGTQDGLNRFDGYTFKVYQHDPGDPGSLRRGTIRDLLEDLNGMIWVAYTHGQGLSRFDPVTERFTNYQHDPDDPTSPSSYPTLALHEDSQGTLWIGSGGGGLHHFDPATQAFTQVLPDSFSEPARFVLSVLEDRAGILWVGTGDGLYRYDRSTAQFTHFRPAPSDEAHANRITALYEDQQGSLWVGAWGLHQFDRATETFTSFLMDPQAAEPLIFGVNRIDAIVEDETSTLWAGGSGGIISNDGSGLNRFDRATGTFTRYLSDSSDPRSLMNNNITAMYQDRQGLLWVSNGEGVSRVDRTVRLFTHYRIDSSNPNGLHGDIPSRMYLDRDDVLWIRTRDGVLNRFDRRNNIVTHYRPGSFPNIRRDRQGRLVAGTGFGTEWRRFDEQAGRFIPHEVTSPCGDGLAGPIYENPDGELFRSRTQDAIHLHWFDIATRTCIDYPHDISGMVADQVRAIYNDQAGHLWWGTRDGGLYRITPETITQYRHDPEDANSLGADLVSSLYERPQEPGILWVSTFRGGLNRMDVATGRFTRYTLQNSDLPNNTVYGVLGDAEGYLWMSTNRGLARFDPDTETFEVYDTDDGLQMLEFDIEAFHQGYTGELFFAGSGGVNAIRPGQAINNPNPPQVALTGLRLGREVVTPDPDGPLKQRLAETTALTLTRRQNDLTLSYVGLHFRHPEKNRYQYRLDGYDETWSEETLVRQATYTNLPPGAYTFRVKAANSDGVWNEEGARLSITILPPWWRTIWAYVLYGLLFAAGVFAVDRFQRRRLIRKERERAHNVLQKAHTDLEETHQHLKATQAQLIQQEKMASLGQLTAGIAHEIKNPLNFVNNFAEVNEELAQELREAIDADEDKTALKEIIADLEQNAQVIAQHGKRADGIVHAMMQHASGGTGQREATAVNALVEEYVGLAYHGKRAQVPDFNVEIVRDLGEAVGSVSMIPQEIGRVLLNLLGNAFDAVHERADAETRRHGDAEMGYTPTVKVSTRRTGKMVEIRVADNGPGIHKDFREKIFEPFYTTKPTGSGTGLGLSLAYDIVTQGHGGTLTVESKEGQGATFIVILPGGVSDPAFSRKTNNTERGTRNPEPNP